MISVFDEMVTHSRSSHNGDITQCSLEFDWVLLLPGPGHVEMNMLKSLVSLLWDVFWVDLVKLMHFKSDDALKAAKRVPDQHKGWQLACIAREALCKELMIPFVREELAKDNSNITSKNFQMYIMMSANATYLFISDIMFEYFDAIFLYRMFLYRQGVREENSSFINSGLSKFAKVWSGRNHPLYRELELSHQVLLLRLPENVRKLVDSSCSISLVQQMDQTSGWKKYIRKYSNGSLNVLMVLIGKLHAVSMTNYSNCEQISSVTLAYMIVSWDLTSSIHWPRKLLSSE